MRKLFTLLLALAGLTSLSAQDEYRIAVTIEGYQDTMLRLANNVLDKQYLVDTAYRNADGQYVFSGPLEELPQGIYLVVTAPDNDYFQILVGQDRRFDVMTQTSDLADLKVKGDKENELFLDYLAFIAEVQEESTPLQESLRDTTLTEAARAELEKGLEVFDERVTQHQDKLIKKQPASFTAAIIRANRQPEPPEFPELEGDDQREAQWRWLQTHYFDNLDLRDERLLRTPFLFNKLNYYVDGLTIQHPDSVAESVDFLLDKMDPQSDFFKFYVVHFINKAASSKVVGMDKVYVHMVDNYYANGRAYWADEEQLAKMIDNAERTRPLLIGKPAPDLELKRRDGTDFRLYDVKAKYTILYYWQFACPSCKKSTPFMKDFYAKWQPRGVEVISICTRQREIDNCWKYVDDNDIGDWLHATDKYQRFARIYDVRSTPTIYILDENKEIISKRIGAQQLDEILEMFEARKAAESTDGE